MGVGVGNEICIEGPNYRSKGEAWKLVQLVATTNAKFCVQKCDMQNWLARAEAQAAEEEAEREEQEKAMADEILREVRRPVAATNRTFSA